MAQAVGRTLTYKLIQQDIVRRIDSGELKPGDAIESERALSERHGVSLMTARHALQGLEREGVVERRSGVGTFVAQPRIHFNKLMSFSEYMSERNLSSRSRVLSLETVVEEEVAAKLGISPGDKLIKFSRLRLGGSEPFTLQTVYLPADKFSELTRESLQRGSLFHILEKNFGVQVAYADGDVDATTATGQTAKLLGVPENSPVLRIRQIAFSPQGLPISYGHGLYRADRHVIHIRRFR
jgi:GntR family transcriptional regulator